MCDDITIVPLEASHLLEIVRQPSQMVQMGIVASFTPEEAAATAGQKVAYAVLDGGRIVLCGGIIETFPGKQGVAWAIFAEGLRRIHVKATRFARAQLAACGLARVEAIAIADQRARDLDDACLLATPEMRWAWLLGMTPGHLLRQFGAASETMVLFERLPMQGIGQSLAKVGTGGILGAAGSIFQGVAGYNAGQQNQQADDVAAINAQRLGVAQQSRIRDSVRSAVGSQIAGQWSNGMMGGTGSAIDAVHESLVQGALDALTVRNSAAAKADALTRQGDIAAQEGENSLMTGFLGAGSKYLSSTSDWAVAHRGLVPASQSASASGGGYYSRMDTF